MSENPSGGRVIQTRRVIPARREHADGEDAGGGDVRGEHPSGAAEREVPGDHVAVAIAAEVGRRGERVSAGPGRRNVVGCATKGGRRGMRADRRVPREEAIDAVDGGERDALDLGAVAAQDDRIRRGVTHRHDGPRPRAPVWRADRVRDEEKTWFRGSRVRR